MAVIKQSNVVANSGISSHQSLKLEFYTEISTYVFHSQKPADLNFPPKHMRTANVSIIFKTYQMISKFHLYFRTDVESYFLIGQLHVNQIHRPISVLTLFNFTFSPSPAERSPLSFFACMRFLHAGRYLPQNCSGFINRKKTSKVTYKSKSQPFQAQHAEQAVQCSNWREIQISWFL